MVGGGSANAARGDVSTVSLRGLGQDVIHCHQFMGFQTGVVARGLRAVGAVFRTAAGFD